MRAHQVMTKNVITVTPTTPILDAANLILRRHISGLPVLDETGALVGIITQSDFLHRSEIGTQRKRSQWLQFLIGPRGLAADFVQERGLKVDDVMTRNPVTVQEDTTLDELVDLMEMHRRLHKGVSYGDVRGPKGYQAGNPGLEGEFRQKGLRGIVQQRFSGITRRHGIANSCGA